VLHGNFYATALAASCSAPQANGNDFYFFRNAGGELDQSMTTALQNVAVAATLPLQYVTWRYVRNAEKRA